MKSRFGDRERNRHKVAALVLAVASIGALSTALIFLFAAQPTTHSAAAPTVEREPTIPTRQVLVALQDIDSDSPVRPEMFRPEERPTTELPLDVVRGVEEVRGQFARTVILRGQVIHRRLITNEKHDNTITRRIPEGYRAVTISVDALKGVEGWARADARVDVNWVGRVESEMMIQVIANNALVLSAERSRETTLREGMPVPTTVTLLATAEDANRIQLGQNTGVLSLVLRGDDDQKAGPSVIPFSSLVRRTVPVVEPKRDTVVVRGPNGEIEKFTFDNRRLVKSSEN